MSVTQPNINQFAQTTVQGQIDLDHGNVITGQVDSSQATALIAGQAVKITTTAGGLPKFVALAANTDQTFGFVIRNVKDQDYPALSNFELAMNDSIMWMAATGAITRGASVEVAYATNQIAPSAGINPVVGIALDTAVNANDLIRVYIKVPTVVANPDNAGLQTITVLATLAQINAGAVIIPAIAGKKITVTNYTARVAGNFATGTSVELESSATTVAVTTLGTGYAAALPAGEGLNVANNGTAQTGGTSITFTVTYQQV